MTNDPLLDKLNRARGRHALRPEILAALDRLRKGQNWLVAAWEELWTQADVTDQAEAFQKSFDAWVLLEADLRSKWGYRDCVIGPDGCHEDAPIRCDFCAGGPTPGPAIMVCDRSKPRTSTKAHSDRPPRPQSGQADCGDQGALFNMGRRPD